MEQERYTQEQIIGFPNAHKAGVEVPDPVREHEYAKQGSYR